MEKPLSPPCVWCGLTLLEPWLGWETAGSQSLWQQPGWNVLFGMSLLRAEQLGWSRGVGLSQHQVPAVQRGVTNGALLAVLCCGGSWSGAHGSLKMLVQDFGADQGCGFGIS